MLNTTFFQRNAEKIKTEVVKKQLGQYHTTVKHQHYKKTTSKCDKNIFF